ncbi:MAG TPA: hypothetical protein VIX62_12935 [Actinomycetota bacterium]
MARFRYPDPLEPPPYPVTPSSSSPIAPSGEDQAAEAQPEEGITPEAGDPATPD